MTTITTIDYALMAGASYISTRDDINKFPIPSGWLETKHANPQDGSGFEAISFINGTTIANSTEIVISFAGTGQLNDWWANAGLATGFGSDQLRQAALYYCQVKAANPDAVISFTGHSLGGGLASLLGVFFDRPAVTFDQAPFRLSATTGMRDDLLAYLGTNGFAGADLQPLRDFIGLTGRAGNVTGLYVQGEFITTTPPFSAFYGIGAQDPLTHGDYFGPVDLHSQALLTAFVQSDSFRQITFKLTDLLGMVFDSRLYKKDTGPNSDKVNLLEHLVRHEAGVQGSFDADAMLTRFTSDLWKLAQDGGLSMTDGNGGFFSGPTNNLSKTLIAFAMQKYYEETSASAGYRQEFFSDLGTAGTGSNGIRFDMADVSPRFAAAFQNGDKLDLKEAKGFDLYFRNYLLQAIFTNGERQIIQSLLPTLRDWYVQAGAGGMTATDAQNQGAFMLGGHGADSLAGEGGNDRLAGGEGNDVILGGRGADRLWGGTGNDYLDGGADDDELYGDDDDDILIGGAGDDRLEGGSGRDTYIINRGDGRDTIVDTLSDNNILRFGTGIGAGDITLRLGSLMLDLGNGDAVHIEGFNPDDVFNSSAINGFEFADGTTLTTNELLARGEVLHLGPDVAPANGESQYHRNKGWHQSPQDGETSRLDAAAPRHLQWYSDSTGANRSVRQAHAMRRIMTCAIGGQGRAADRDEWRRAA